MPEWLRGVVQETTPIAVHIMAWRIVIALALGALVAWAYVLTHGRSARETRTLATTIVLLTGLLAMVSMVIGDSVARAFGLVGALSIVRFRTVVNDTRDTAFVIFSVIVGMAVGTGLLMVAAVGVPIVCAAAFVMDGRGDAKRDAACRLIVRLALGKDPEMVEREISKLCGFSRGVSARTAKQGAAIEVVHEVRLPQGKAADVVVALCAIDGIQDVEVEPLDER